jgi:hypothetical protein
MPILRPGTFNGIEVTKEHLEALVRNFTPRVRKAVQPYLRAGHTVMRDDHVIEQPAWGRVEALALHERPGEPPVVWATVIGAPPSVARAIEAGLYHSRSAELEFAFAETPAAKELDLTDVEGPILMNVALLGASVPAVTGLDGVINLTNELRAFTTQLAVAKGKTPSRLHCTEASVARDDGESQEKDDMNDAIEQLHAMRIASRELKKRTLKLGERLDRFEADNEPIHFAYSPSVASGVGRLGQTWISRVEAMVAQLHLNRDDPKDRATAAEAALRKWHDEDPKSAEELPTTTYNWSIDKFAPSGGRDTNPSLRDGPPSPALEALPYGESYGSGGDRDRDLTADRIARLKSIAERRKWNLWNHSERDLAMATLFAEDGRSVHTARTFDEALHAYLREKRLDFTEANRREAALAVAAARDDLVGEAYGASRLIPSSTDVDDCAAKFSEKVAQERSRLPNRYEAESLAEATALAAKKYPHLVPSQGYGSRRRSQ